MFKNFFRIGFGGCGCALADTFKEHANELFRGILLDYYGELVRWGKVLSNENRLEMKEFLAVLKNDIFERNVNLDTIEEHLNDWLHLLDTVSRSMRRYERMTVEQIIRISQELKYLVERLKEYGGVWFEGVTVDSYSGEESVEKGRYLYNKYLDESRQIRINEFGMDILDAEGFNHHPELQMLPLSLQEVRTEVYSDLDKIIKEATRKASRGHFFFLGLGGGTGTGVISPLAEEFAKGTRGYFTLGVLGGVDDNDYLNSQQPWFRRCFNMLLALNDLIVTADLDGLILVDNERLMASITEKLEKREFADLLDDESLTQFLLNELDIEWVKGANIERSKDERWINVTKDDNFAEIFITRESTKEGTARLRMCDGRVYTLDVFLEKTDGKIVKTMVGRTNEQKVDEELIRKIFLAFSPTACEKTAHGKEGLDWSQLRDAMAEYDDTLEEKREKTILVPCYASGNNENAAELFVSSLKEGKLAECDHRGADRVFVYLRNLKYIEKDEKENFKKEVTKEFDNVKDKDIGFIDEEEDPDQVKEKLGTKKVIVFGVKGKKETKKDEVLILLRNPNIKKLLDKRLSIAGTFISLLNDFVDLVENGHGESYVKRAEYILANQSDNFKEYLEDGRIPTEGIEKFLFTWSSDKRFLRNEEQMNIKKYLKDDLRLDWAEKATIYTQNNIVIIEDANNKVHMEIDGTNNNVTVTAGSSRIESTLEVKEVGTELRIYKGEKEPLKKILEEAKNFLFPKVKKIPVDKQNFIYDTMKKVTKTLTTVVTEAQELLERGDWPIFKERIFEIKQALASSDEIELTTLLAAGTMDEYRKALGAQSVNSRFANYQAQVLKDSDYVEGSNSENYILTDSGERALAESGLKNELDKINVEIEDPYTLFDTIPRKTLLSSSEKIIETRRGNINFPILLILSLLYTKWECVCGWDNICGGDGNEDEKFIKELSKESDFEWVTNGAVIEPLELDKNAVSISNAEHLAEITICEKKEENRRFKEIHAGRYLTTRDIGRDDLNEDAIRNELDKVSRTDGFALPDKFKLEEEGVNKWWIINNTGNETEYYVRIKNGSLKIFGEAKILGLKVKEAEEGKLKIYKRREKEYEPITTEKGVSISRPLDVPVSEVEIDKLKAEMCNLKDRIDKMVANV